MGSDSKTAAKIAALKEEMEAIHSANSLYWRRGEEAAVEARAAYQRRLERLEAIRT